MSILKSTIQVSGNAVTDVTSPSLNILRVTKAGVTSDIAINQGTYTLPTASATVLGGIKVGAGLSISNGVLATSTQGTVTSVGLSLPNIFSVSGSPITGAGTLTGALATQGGFSIFGNHTNASAVPTFGKIPVQSVNASGSVYDGTKFLKDNGTWEAISFPASTGNYVLQSSTPQFTPVINTQYFFGGMSGLASSTQAINRIYIPKAGTITKVVIFYTVNAGVLGTAAENTVFTLISTIGSSNTTNAIASTPIGLTKEAKIPNTNPMSVVVSEGDYVEIKMLTPSSSTGSMPTNMRFSFIINIDT